MKTVFLSILSSLLLYGSSTPFQLQTDIYDFPNKLSENDTLILIVDKSVCVSRTVDRTVITSSGNQTFIQTEITDDTQQKIVLQKSAYISHQDTLNLQNLVSHMKEYGTNHRDDSTPLITAIYKTDTIHYYALSLTKRLNNIHYYDKVMSRIYPNEQNYQPVVPPKVE